MVNKWNHTISKLLEIFFLLIILWQLIQVVVYNNNDSFVLLSSI